MDNHREADVSDRFRHVFADPHPSIGRAIQAIDAAMVLLIQPVRIARAQADTVRIMERHCARIESFDDLEPFDQRDEGLASVHRFMDAAAGHRKIEVLGVTRINNDGMKLGPVRSAVLDGAHPFDVLGILIDIGERRPGHAAILDRKSVV